MTPNEFIQEYPNDFIYRVNFPNGRVNYISSPVELGFKVSDVNKDGISVTGKSFVIKNPTSATYYRLTSNGNVNITESNDLYILSNSSELIGYIGDIDIYKWNGSSFFLPLPSTFLRDLVGKTLMILPVGFGVLSVMLLILLLVVYFRRYLHRLI